jgi:GNAT superfamily N-acetyltransferase
MNESIDGLKFTSEPDVRETVELLKEVFYDDPGVSRMAEYLQQWGYCKGAFRAALVTNTGKVKSFCVLLPRAIVVDGVRIQAGQVELVATEKSLRGQGLFEKLHRKLVDEAKRRGYPFMLLFGIPSFYRRVGYGFTVRYIWDCSMTVDAAKSISARSSGVVRKAKPEDADAILSLWRKQVKSGARIYLPQSAAEVRNAISGWKAKAHPSYVLRKEDKVVGYFRCVLFKKSVQLVECAGLSAGLLPPVLKKVAQLAVARNLAKFNITLPGPNDALEAARFYGASEIVEMYKYAMQTRVLDLPDLMLKLVPALNRRLANSTFNDAAVTIPCSFFSDQMTIEIESGRVARIGGKHKTPHGKCLRMGRETMAEMLFGTDDFSNLLTSRPDLRCPRKLQPVVNVLFPKLSPYLVE